MTKKDKILSITKAVIISLVRTVCNETEKIWLEQENERK